MDCPRHWLRGWLLLLAPDRLPGWSRLGVWRRGRLRCAALLALRRQRRARLLVLLAVAGVLLGLALCWRLSLWGWPAELLPGLPVLAVAPLLMRLWRAELLARLRRQAPASQARNSRI
ncbi:MAG: hypothetical protein D6727_12580 [Gammaproteobacteria bacterium]|nr:MAG: hypothetical protein D6727_12580 [Gammaproteobacteria bacterium]